MCCCSCDTENCEGMYFTEEEEELHRVLLKGKGTLEARTGGGGLGKGRVRNVLRSIGSNPLPLKNMTPIDYDLSASRKLKSCLPLFYYPIHSQSEACKALDWLNL